MNSSTARSSTLCVKAQIVIESWRRHYNAVRPRASLGYKPPAPQVFVPAFETAGRSTRSTKISSLLPRRYRRSCQAGWPLWLSQDHGLAANRRMGGEQEAGRADLATRGLKVLAKQPKR